MKAANNVLELPEIPRRKGMTTLGYIYERLRNAILLGTLAPGTALTIQGLGDYLSLSKTPIREAIGRLSSEHAIEVLGNRRLRIPLMTKSRFIELIELRVTLETHAAARAMPYVSDIQIDQMRALDDEMERVVAAGDYSNLVQLNLSFHQLLYQAHPDPVAIPMIESVWLQLGPFQRQSVEKGLSQPVIDRHKQILSALHKRDTKELASALENDIRDGVEKWGLILLEDAQADKVCA